MKRVILLFILAMLTGVAQEKKAPPAPSGGDVERLFTIKYADVFALRNLFANFPVQVNADANMRVLAVRGRPETVAAIEDAIRKLDAPSADKNIALTGYLLLASAQASSQPELPELGAVIKEMHALFPYKSYRLLDVIGLRTRDGGDASVSGQLSPLPGAPADFRPEYGLVIGRAMISATDAVRIVRLNGLRLNVVVSPNRSTKIGTDVDLREGQKVVVGKASVSGAEEALVLVLSAKLVE